jgi:hypothetical protein
VFIARRLRWALHQEIIENLNDSPYTVKGNVIFLSTQHVLARTAATRHPTNRTTLPQNGSLCCGSFRCVASGVRNVPTGKLGPRTANSEGWAFVYKNRMPCYYQQLAMDNIYGGSGEELETPANL